MNTTAPTVPQPTQSELVAHYPHQPLKGQAAMVTGANSGIGESVARHLAAAGAATVINYVFNPEVAQAIVNDIIQAGGQAMAIQGDVSKEADVEAMFDQMVKAYGTIDIMVNNA